MDVAHYEALGRFLDTCPYPECTALRQRLNDAGENADQVCQDSLALLEQHIWDSPFDGSLLPLYQRISREYERVAEQPPQRHSFVIAIPVADRPKHLQAILRSILTLCAIYQYGGKDAAGQYHKVRVLIADDSADPDNIRQHRELAEQFTRTGLNTLYFGLEDQQQTLSRLDPTQRQSASRIVGDNPPDHFSRKGPSITRNITYLKLAELAAQDPDTLFYFVDSDQEFKVKGRTDQGEESLYAINYFHYLDRIFRETETQILTGKVVGDPPVSPAVMASNFLDDVLCFLHQMTERVDHPHCEFHTRDDTPADDAAYHDMADLFGFTPAQASYNYRCTLKGEHNHLDCLRDFARKLNHFFDGEHPTRVTWYEPADVMRSIKPARTIYTGNYVFRAAALDYFIPFATLRLRMAGPVLGRILQAELGPRFVSANLPMLHKRTVASTGKSEFRPGIDKQDTHIDLSGEFERQFFGDVMLFSMIELTEQGFPERQLSDQQIQTIVHRIDQQMREKYQNKQIEIGHKLDLLRQQLDQAENAWNSHKDLSESLAVFQSFLGNMEHNFSLDADSYSLINPGKNRDRRIDQICQAIRHYAEDRSIWQRLTGHQRS